MSSNSLPLSRLCEISREACDVMAEMVCQFYLALNEETSTLKADASVFTIADGIVQHLLVNHLFQNKFANVVGEEDGTSVNIVTSPYKVDDLVVPEIFYSTVDQVRMNIDSLSQNIDPSLYGSLTVFIDPIDGTREFATGLGEQCSICIGFSDETGKAVAGIVYRPITRCWAAGASSESYTSSKLNYAEVPNPKGFLTSNGSISPFIKQLITEMGFERVPSGGAGNKMLMVLEGHGAAYIQDRGVSRWDTCGAEAVIEAHGGMLAKLIPFVEDKSVQNYCYLKSNINLDFVPGKSFLTPYNAVDKNAAKAIPKDAVAPVDNVELFKSYSNICGLLALGSQYSQSADHLNSVYEAIQRASVVAQPAYD